MVVSSILAIGADGAPPAIVGTNGEDVPAFITGLNNNVMFVADNPLHRTGITKPKDAMAKIQADHKQNEFGLSGKVCASSDECLAQPAAWNAINKAYIYLPGTYNSNCDLPLGFNMQLLGAGRKPQDVRY